MSFETFELGGIEIPIFSLLGFSQSYEPIGGSALLRMVDGTAVKQQQWEKFRSVVRGTGSIPPGLQNLNYSVSMLMKGASKVGIIDTSNVITVTSDRRSDTPHAPRGFAMIDRELVDTSIGFSVDEATLGVVSGADFYVIHYWPQFNVFATKPSIQWEENQKNVNWELVMEET